MSKANTGRVKEDAKGELKPKLRFPGFEGAWELKSIAQHLEDCSSRIDSDTELPVFTSSRAGLMPQDEYYGGQNRANENLSVIHI